VVIERVEGREMRTCPCRGSCGLGHFCLGHRRAEGEEEVQRLLTSWMK